MYIAATAMLAYLAMCNTSSEVDTTQFEVILTTIASVNAVIWFTVNVVLNSHYVGCIHHCGINFKTKFLNQDMYAASASQNGSDREDQE